MMRLINQLHNLGHLIVGVLDTDNYDEYVNALHNQTKRSVEAPKVCKNWYRFSLLLPF
jgi:hypothetical protein